VNAAAARAWTAYERSRARILTAGQLARMQRILGAAMEHGMTGM
jgi:N-acyl-D-aspartate/D-glutamate deacylase